MPLLVCLSNARGRPTPARVTHAPTPFPRPCVRAQRQSVSLMSKSGKQAGTVYVALTFTPNGAPQQQQQQAPSAPPAHAPAPYPAAAPGNPSGAPH